MIGPTPFPSITPAAIDSWQWPAPPFAWRHTPAADDAAQPCCIETHNTVAIEGDMLGIDADLGRLSFRPSASAAGFVLPFSRFRRLTLTEPLQPATPPRGAPVERLPAAAQERGYRLRLRDGNEVLTGRSFGHVETATALYLFAPFGEENAVQRILVPRCAYTGCEFEPSAQELAAKAWIADPEALRRALQRQNRMPVLPLGQSLLRLGLVTQGQLDRALAVRSTDLPLGEMLVASGELTRADLQTALAHKMGYPLVDLNRFPIDTAAVQRLPRQMALRARAIPLLIDDHRLIVAVDRPDRAVKLRALHAFADLTVVPVLASKSQIHLALTRLSEQDIWSENVLLRLPQFFATTA